MSSFVAVICLNDYPHSVTRTYETREEADRAAQEERQRLQVAADAENQKSEAWNRRYYHYHVLEQPERRQIMRREAFLTDFAQSVIRVLIKDAIVEALQEHAQIEHDRERS